MRRILFALLGLLALGTPRALDAQQGVWTTQQNGQELRTATPSGRAAVAIRQDGPGPILTLRVGTTVICQWNADGTVTGSGDCSGGGGGGATPGGSNTQVQFNDSGAFGGDSGFTYDKTQNTVNIAPAMTSTSFDAGIDVESTFSPTGTASGHFNIYSFLQTPTGNTQTINNVLGGLYSEVLNTRTGGTIQALEAGIFQATQNGPGTTISTSVQGIYSEARLTAGTVTNSVIGIEAFSTTSGGTAGLNVIGERVAATTTSSTLVPSIEGVEIEAHGASVGGATDVYGLVSSARAAKDDLYGAVIGASVTTSQTGVAKATSLSMSTGSGAFTVSGGVYGLDVTVTHQAAANNTVYGVNISATDTGSGTPPNIYGLKIADVTGGTNNYAIYTGAGTVHIGGTLDAASTVAPGSNRQLLYNDAGTLAASTIEYWKDPTQQLFIFTPTITDPGNANIFNVQVTQNPSADGKVSSAMQVTNSVDAANTHAFTSLGGIDVQSPHNGSGAIPSHVGLSTGASNAGAGAVTNGVGLSASYFNTAGGSVAYSAGAEAYSYNTGAGTVTDSAALAGSIGNTGAGTTTNGYGLWIFSAEQSGMGAITNNYGIKIDDQTAGGTTNYAIYTGAGAVRFGDNVKIAAKHLELSEQTAPSAPGANDARIYAVDNGSGKTQLCVLFSSGAAQCFATQP